jgi:hypothetical protein
MRLFLAALFGACALITSMPSADARDGCGRGWYFDGRACRPMGGGGYGGGPAYGPAYGPPPPAYYGGCAPRRSPTWPCPCGNYTVQDGVCKPYTGR